MSDSNLAPKPPRFAVPVSIAISASPLEVFKTAATRQGAWLWPGEPATAVGQVNDMGAVVTDFEPGVKYRNHMEGPDGWFNTLTFDISMSETGTQLDYLHEGMFADNYALQLEACTLHTRLYIETLAAAAEHFAGLDNEYFSVDAPESSNVNGLSRMLEALGLSDAALGSQVDVTGGDDDLVRLRGVVDFRTEHFFGVRDENTFFRIFDRGVWGGGVTVVWHVFESTQPTGDVLSASEIVGLIQSPWEEFVQQVFGPA